MVVSSGRPRRFDRRRLLTALACVLAAMVAGEFAVRLLWRPSIVGADRYSRISPTFDFGFEPARPACIEDGDRWLCMPTQYRYAIRRQTLPRRKAGDAVRFVTLGGSVSAGGPESYAHRLRDELETRYGAVRWESLNLSNPGFGTARMRVLMEEVPRLEPDFVILDCTGTNEFEDERDRARRDHLNGGLGAVLYRSWALVLIKKKLFPRLGAAGRDAGPRYRGPTEQEASAVEANVERWLATLDRNLSAMVRIAREHGLSVVLMGRSVRGPIAPGSRLDRINDVIRSHAVGADVLFVDAQTAMHRRGRADALYLEDGLHPSDAGHAALAGVLAERLVPGLPAVEARVLRIAEEAEPGR